MSDERPDDRRILRTLAWLLRAPGRYDEALAFADRAIALPGGDAYAWFIRSEILMLAGRIDEALVAAEKSLAQQVGPRALMQIVTVQVFLRDDSGAAAEVIGQTPGSILIRDLETDASGGFWLYHRQPEKSLERYRAFDGDFLRGKSKGCYVGCALAMAGRPEAAQLEWRAAFRVVEIRLAAKPEDVGLLYWKAQLLACLGAKEAAGQMLPIVRQLDLPGGPGWDIPIPLLLARRGKTTRRSQN